MRRYLRNNIASFRRLTVVTLYTHCFAQKECCHAKFCHANLVTQILNISQKKILGVLSCMRSSVTLSSVMRSSATQSCNVKVKVTSSEAMLLTEEKLCHAKLCHAKFCHVMQSYVMQSYVMRNSKFCHAKPAMP